MGIFEISAAVLVGNLLSAWFLFGLHIACIRGEHTGAKWAVGGTFMAMSGALALASPVVGDADHFAVLNAAGFIAAIIAVAFVWGVYAIGKHEERGDMSTAPLTAWVATLVPIGIAVAYLWRYAPIG